jgi:glycerol-3-phosphate acyltransferase PlsY
MAAMSDLAVVLLLVPVAYVLGTFPSAGLVARRAGVDVTAAGSGNPGASNTFRLLGWRAGVAVFLLDAAKGALGAGVGLAVDGHRGAYLLGIAAVVGHMLPATRRNRAQRFKGGRGVATGAGVLAVVFPLVVLVLAALWGAVVGITRKASVASLTVAVAFPIAVLVTGESAADVVVVSVLAVLVIVRHSANLRRLLRGEEHDLGATGGAAR